MPKGFRCRLAEADRHYLGFINIFCRNCGALHFITEKSVSESDIFEKYCKNNDIKLNLLSIPEEPLRSLLSDKNPKNRYFQQNIRQYNSAFAFTSINYKRNKKFDSNIHNIIFQMYNKLYYITEPL